MCGTACLGWHHFSRASQCPALIMVCRVTHDWCSFIRGHTIFVTRLCDACMSQNRCMVALSCASTSSMARTDACSRVAEHSRSARPAAEVLGQSHGESLEEAGLVHWCALVALPAYAKPQ